jgi:hypothetical protein
MDVMQFLLKAQTVPKELRRGQHLMNLLWLYRSDLFEKIHNTGLDCFYQDSVIQKTEQWLMENWEMDTSKVG